MLLPRTEPGYYWVTLPEHTENRDWLPQPDCHWYGPKLWDALLQPIYAGGEPSVFAIGHEVRFYLYHNGKEFLRRVATPPTTPVQAPD